jgi:hypothetical protein
MFKMSSKLAAARAPRATNEFARSFSRDTAPIAHFVHARATQETWTAFPFSQPKARAKPSTTRLGSGAA